ncbi:MAG: YggS family pyridoxal phosphate-dependent enzyme [Myxococcales bacterium]|nr:YggS family pyridoxal phosphate-dependent enzyme [Myxococcales bacterium]
MSAAPGATIAERWHQVSARVRAAAAQAGREPAAVTLVAVSKTHPMSAIVAAVAAGARDFGENYVQELVDKQQEPAPAADVRWHYIGRLQRNKARFVAGKVALIHAVDSLELAVELSRRAAAVQPVLVAVNLAGEATKAGVSPLDAARVCAEIARLPNLRLDGLMTMPPPVEDPEQVRPVFRALAELRRRLQDELAQPLPSLSMGMSGDFEVAISEGATHVRVGTAIFGERPRPG